MWPFSCNKRPTPVPAIRCGDIDVTWNPTFHGWEFSVGDIAYSQHQNPVFDQSVFAKLPEVRKWLEVLDSEINEEIKKHLAGWCDWKGQKELVGIDVSRLISRNEAEVSYAHEDWGDLGVDIVITNGRITSSDAGD